MEPGRTREETELEEWSEQDSSSCGLTIWVGLGKFRGTPVTPPPWVPSPPRRSQQLRPCQWSLAAWAPGSLGSPPIWKALRDRFGVEFTSAPAEAVPSPEQDLLPAALCQRFLLLGREGEVVISILTLYQGLLCLYTCLKPGAFHLIQLRSHWTLVGY